MATLPSDKYSRRFAETLRLKRDLETQLLASLDAVVRGLSSGLVDLNDQRGDLLELRTLADKLLRLNDAGTQTVAAGVGHLADNLDGMRDDRVTGELADLATLIINERELIRSSGSLALAWLETVDPAVFRAAFARLPVERQAALTMSEHRSATDANATDC